MKVLSWDVGIIHLAYCLMEYHPENNKYEILSWNLIDLSYKKEHQCSVCQKKALYQTLNQDNQMKEFCGIHIKKVNKSETLEFENFFKIEKTVDKCQMCETKASCFYQDKKFCKNHAKIFYKKFSKDNDIVRIKKEKTTSDVDLLRYRLVEELEKRSELFQAEMILVENQPALKNPTMKAISSTIYDFYLIRGIFDKKYQSKIQKVKFMSPCNKIKLSDKCELVYNADKNQKYKLTKQLAVEYVSKLLEKDEKWIKHFKSFSKKDDLADAFLQGAYFIQKNIT